MLRGKPSGDHRRQWMTFILVFSCFFITGQVSDPEAVKSMISRFKQDARGPYRDIRWFCKDGSTRAARDPCTDQTGNQRARYKEEVDLLAARDHIFLGQILATTPYTDIWDESSAHSRMIQYQLEQYLRSMDNGWIHRRAQFYRGAVQIEDEHRWGAGFYQSLLEDTFSIHSRYFLLRQSARDIPHSGDDNTAQRIRSLCKEISDSLPSFMDLRVKIHGAPDAGDIQKVNHFRQGIGKEMTAALNEKFDLLLRELTIMYQPFMVSDLEDYRRVLPETSPAKGLVTVFMNGYPLLAKPEQRCRLISRTAMMLRHQLASPMQGISRLALIDVSNKMENLIIIEASRWKAGSVRELISQVYCLSEAVAAFGYLELWEWEQVSSSLELPAGDSISLNQLNALHEGSRRVLEWATGLFRAHYQPVVNRYRDFEPLAAGFLDDRVRSSVLLHLGRAVSQLGEAWAREAGFSNSVLGIAGQSSIRGLNPGFALGELVVVTGTPEKEDLSSSKIYVFHHPPGNLKPVAGILTVSEGNMVSHVQLLARNLGIPNAVISQENMESLKAFHGTPVFYAVSQKGTVIIKPAAAMEPREKELFEQKKRKAEKISVPMDRIVLDQAQILNLRQVSASESGKTCGPKAAHLGQLKQIFPGQVVEGLVLPFAVFKQHMDQRIPSYETSYWDLMKGIFTTAERMRARGDPEAETEAFILKGLDSLRRLIRKMPLLYNFRKELEKQFQTVFSQPLGKIPVFVRSDTNMEDLRDFSGAGLNLTVFNVLDSEKIYQGIRDVWASPYTERSFRWRQHYLENPENVFPSILIIPSVDPDCSGVLITKGLSSGSEGDLTVAFNRGVAGAVEGQVAETWLLDAEGKEHLVSPARELFYLTIPATGGSLKVRTGLEKRILTPERLGALRKISQHLIEELSASPEVNNRGPLDVELGFLGDKIWLFQVRPFVENKLAAATEYLRQITPAFDGDRSVSLNSKLDE